MTRDFSRLLIANRGEIARRIARSASRLGIETVAVFSDPDRGSPLLAEVDEAFHLPGSSPAETYLRGDLLIEAARRSGAQAVHPGYGFLSENAEFAEQCAAAGLVFVGPPPHVIEAMGSKIRAKALMSAAGVPVLPSLVVAEVGAGDLVDAATEQVGFPLLVKASYGGGGRGMRVVHSAPELLAAVAAASREAEGAFGDGTVMLERLVERPRHIEAQIMGDEQGNVAHLFERECSIQRRYQKVLEESPSPLDRVSLREELADAAVAAGKAIGYVNAGTVEFVADDSGHFWFLEVNTRLQVEHPVTEMVTGVDLVAVQLHVAAGGTLPPEVLDARCSGHAIEARLYAEDVAAGFLPASGTLGRFRWSELPHVRVDAGYGEGCTVGTHYDAMLAKVIAWAPTRAAAAARLAQALRRMEISGVTTNRSLLVHTLEQPEFLAGQTDTDFFARHDPVELAAPVVQGEEEVVRLVAAAAGALLPRKSPIPAGVPVGWRNVGGADQSVELVTEDERTIRVTCTHGRDGLDVSVGGVPLPSLTVRAIEEDAVELELDGRRRVFEITASSGGWTVTDRTASCWFREVDRFPSGSRASRSGSLDSPMPGAVTQLTVAVGDAVVEGQLVVAIEAMKMEHPIHAPHAGTVTDVLVALSDQVDTGQTLLVVAPQAPVVR